MDNLQKMEQGKVTPKDSIMREKLVIGFTSVFEALFLLLELYFMIHSDDNFTVMIVIAICMVLVLFFLVMAIIDLSQKTKRRELQEFEDIYKAQKASYLATKKYFDEIGDRLSTLEENTAFPAEDIISAQKAMAKVTISRNKENAEALMNANDELIQRVFGFEEKLSDSNQEILRQQQDLIQQTKEDMERNHQSMQDQFQALQDALQQMQQSATFIPPTVENTLQEDAPIPQETMSVNQEMTESEETEFEAASQALDDLLGEQDMSSLDDMEEELPSLDDIDVELPEIDNLAIEEETSETDNLAMEEEMPDLSDPNKQLSADEIAALFANADVAEEPESIPEAEIESEEAPEVPDLSDPNKQLSADEIAALFANADAIEEPEPIPEPEIEEQPEEDTLPMPDLSDPNKTLSPDEIAALFANM